MVDTDTDLLGLWLDSGGRIFDALPFEIETTYSKNSRDGVIRTRRTVADEFTESTAFYRDLNQSERALFFGTGKMGYGPIGESLKNRLEANGITRFTAEDGTVDFEAVISEFRRQWSNFERGGKYLKERAEAQGEHDRASLEERGWITDDAEGQARFDAERASAEQGGLNPVTGLPRVADEHGEIFFRRKITSQRPEDYDKENGTQLAQIVDYTNAIDAHDTARKDKHLHKHYVLANTSDFLRGLGIKGTRFTISSNGIKRHHGKNAAHSISTDEWIGISYSLSHERPLAVFKYRGEGGTRENAYRIWTRAEIAGRMAVVGVEVKSNGREMYVNAVDTIFGAEKITANKELRLYPKSEQEFQSVLDGLNSRKYPETPAGGERTRADAPATDNIVSNSAAPRQGGDNGIRYSVGGIYTGTAADYANRSRQGGKDDGPSLLKIGTGEGAQVYGWGLYGSTVRGVAEGYAKDAREYNAEKNGKRIDLIFPKNMLEAETAKRLMENGGDVRKTIEKLKLKGIGSAIIKELEEHGAEYSVAHQHEQLYEQTFFTDRTPGDESHLLKWYEPVTKEQKQWILKEAFSETAGFEAPVHSQNVIEERFAREDLNLKGEDVYVLIEHELGSPKAASEFLARAGIDGVKYPVDSYGKTVKDGDEVGWNYVSFRDDNIRVDHKWTDGQMRYSRRLDDERKYSYEALVAKPDMKVPRLGTVKTVSRPDGNGFATDTKDILRQAIEAIKSTGVTVDGKSAVRVEDLGRDVVVDMESLRHTKPQAIAKFPDVYASYGRILANSIIVNEAAPTDTKRSSHEYVALGMAYNRRGRPVFVRTIIDSRNGADKISKTEVAYAADARKGNPMFSLHANGLAGEGQSRAHLDDGITPSSVSKSETVISIANFLEACKGVFGDVFSRDVNAKIGAQREGTKLGNSLYYATGGGGAEAQPPSFGRVQYVRHTRVPDDAQGRGERSVGGLAASQELMRTGAVPLTTRGTRYVSLPLSEIHHLAGALGVGKKNRLKFDADLIGMIDRSDMLAEKATLRQHGFFRHEDPNWAASARPADLRAERERSDDALSARLEKLADDRISGKMPGGMAAATRVYADGLAKIVMRLPHGQTGTLGKMQTVAGALQKRVNGNEAEADAFLDWMNGAAQPVQRSAQDRKAEMFGAFLIMPKEMESKAKGWYDAIRSTIAGDMKLADAFRSMTVRMMTPQAHIAIQAEIEKVFDLQHEQAVKAIRAEANEPIKPGSWWDGVKEGLAISFDDRLGGAAVRVNAMLRIYNAAEKEAIRKAPDAAAKAAVKQRFDQLRGDIAQAKNQLELSRTAFERGATNVDARYAWRVVDAINEATVRDGLPLKELSLYLDQKRVVETKGLSGARGQSARQAQLVLDTMKRRMGAATFAKVEAFAAKFHAIHEQELVNDPVLERVMGKAVADYWRSQVDYVTTKRTFSPEELAEINAARAAIKANSGSNADDVVGQMFDYLVKPDATAKLRGSLADKQEVISATLEKVAAVKRFLRRSEFIIDLRDMLLAAKVEGVHDLPQGKSEFPHNARYGSVTYMENGRKRTLVLPRQIADGLNAQQSFDNPVLKLCANVNNFARKALIDFNPVYWQRNISRNVGSIEQNMPGMKESAIKRGLRFVAPGLAPVTDLALQHLVRHIPEKLSLPLRTLWGKHTALYYAPHAKRIALWITDHNTMQRKLWDAQAAGDLGTIQQLEQDRADALQIMKANMFVASSWGDVKKGGTTSFLDDALAASGASLMKPANPSGDGRAVLGQINIFQRNANQQVFEDVHAKICAYLHDRAQFGISHTSSAEESGLVVKRNVSIAEGERKGAATRAIQATVQPFWGMVEKGVVRSIRAFAERPRETLEKAAWRIGPRILNGILGSGALAAYILRQYDGDERRARASALGDVYDYARFVQRTMQNCSNYVRGNYHVTPLMTDGYTSIIIGMPLTDEERLLEPIAHFVSDAAAVAAGAKPKLDVASALDDAYGVIAPDFKVAGFLPTLLDDTVHALVENPTDYYTGSTKYDKDLYAVRNDSWGMRGKFALAMAKRLWNDFGGRSYVPVDRQGVDNGLGTEAPWVSTMLNDIPLASPMLRAFIKVQVGSPKRDAAPVTDADNRRRALIRVHAKELFDDAKSSGRDISADPDRYRNRILKWQQAEGFSDHERAQIEAKYFNAWHSYNAAHDRADSDRAKSRRKASSLGFDNPSLWLDFD